MKRLLICALAAVTMVPLGATSAGALPTRKLSAELGAVWTKVLQTPDAQNPFGSGGLAYSCIDVGGTVVPLGGGTTGVPACTLATGTKLLVFGFTLECSTFEGTAPDEAALRTCAENADLQTAPEVTLDGQPLVQEEIETSLLQATLPADNVFGLPAGTTGLFVAHGWASWVHPLSVGQHLITIQFVDQHGSLVAISTVITVVPGRH